MFYSIENKPTKHVPDYIIIKTSNLRQQGYFDCPFSLHRVAVFAICNEYNGIELKK